MTSHRTNLQYEVGSIAESLRGQPPSTGCLVGAANENRHLTLILSPIEAERKAAILDPRVQGRIIRRRFEQTNSRMT